MGAHRCRRISRLRQRKGLQMQAFLKRLMGFEPTTFCMASRTCVSWSARIFPANGGFSGMSSVWRFHGYYREFTGF